MEKLQKAVDELLKEVSETEGAIAAKIADLDTKESKLSQKINSLRQDVVNSELSNNIEKAEKLKKDIAQIKIDMAEIQEQKAAYKQFSAKNRKDTYSKKITKIYELSQEAKEERSKQLEKNRALLDEKTQKLNELEAEVNKIKRENERLRDDTILAQIIRPIIGFVDNRINDPEKRFDIVLTCKMWLDLGEEKFKERMDSYYE